MNLATNSVQETKWKLDDLRWDRFRKELVDPRLLALIKGASLIEFRSTEYAHYLADIFRGDEDLLRDIQLWSLEKRTHGEALRRWSELADPTFDFEESLGRFNKAYPVQLPKRGMSYRGSKTQELVSRCVIEAGASSYYQALQEAGNEPVLKDICGRIAVDEMRHYKLFLQRIEFYEKQEGVGLIRKIKAAAQRSLEVDDAELTFSYFAANSKDPLVKERLPKYAAQYMDEIRHLYQSKHWFRVSSLVVTATSLPQGHRVAQIIGQALFNYSRLKLKLKGLEKVTFK